MSVLRIANRYAEALMNNANEFGLLQKVSNDLLEIQNIINGSLDFRLFLKSPVIKNEKKQQVLEAAFQNTVDPMTLRFLLLLTEKNRENVLPQIIEAFFRLQDELLGIVNVKVRAASELTNHQRLQLEQKFESISHKKIRIKDSVDKQLIGGFIARVGDTVFDGSVRRQLELLKQRLIEGVSKVH
jgi:F-type H+-transporting ATPase subunit delta